MNNFVTPASLGIMLSVPELHVVAIVVMVREPRTIRPSISFPAVLADVCLSHFPAASPILPRAIPPLRWSRAPFAKIEASKKRMGWASPWFSSFGTDFNYDFHVTHFGRSQGQREHNYEKRPTSEQAGKIGMVKGELPGLSVFLRDGDSVFHTYSTYQRSLDLFINTYDYLDLTSFGRQEDDEPSVMTWVRHHDKYSAEEEVPRRHGCDGAGSVTNR